MQEKIFQIIADALYVDTEEVQPDANLMNDLGAESIDFLDIIFRLEKEFNIKIPRGEVEKRAKGSLSDDEFAVDGILTKQGLESLRRAMPELSGEQINGRLFVRDIPGLFTAQTFVRMVEEQLKGSEVEIPTTARSASAAIASN